MVLQTLVIVVIFGKNRCFSEILKQKKTFEKDTQKCLAIHILVREIRIGDKNKLYSKIY